MLINIIPTCVKQKHGGYWAWIDNYEMRKHVRSFFLFFIFIVAYKSHSIFRALKTCLKVQLCIPSRDSAKSRTMSKSRAWTSILLVGIRTNLVWCPNPEHWVLYFGSGFGYIRNSDWNTIKREGIGAERLRSMVSWHSKFSLDRGQVPILKKTEGYPLTNSWRKNFFRSDRAEKRWTW